jgi:hemerythrin-like domain-containing protein
MKTAERIASWHADHVHFARLLDLLDRQLEEFRAGGTPRYDLMQDIVYYMTHYSDVVHHPKEDIVFDIVKARNPALARSVDELAWEHGILRQTGEQLARDLDDIVNGSIEPRERMARAAREYIACMRGHMNVEEAEILPAAQLVLRNDDWDAVDTQIRHVEDPLFGSGVEARYAALREQIARDARMSR